MPIAQLSLVLAMAICGFSAWLFVSAAMHKALDFSRFGATLAAYQLIPQTFTGVFAFVLVGLELLAAVVLLLVFLMPVLFFSNAPYLGHSGHNAVLSAALLAPGLMLGYVVAIGLNLVRGRRSIDCGCGGTPMPLSNALVARNLVLAAGFLWALLVISDSKLWQNGQASVVGMLLLALSSSLVLCFVYLIINQLLANRALHEQLWIQHK